jgi:hypothetical protein
MDYYEKYIKYKKKYTIIRNQTGALPGFKFASLNLNLGLTFDDEEKKQNMVVKNNPDVDCNNLKFLLTSNYDKLTDIKSSEGDIYISKDKKTIIKVDKKEYIYSKEKNLSQTDYKKALSDFNNLIIKNPNIGIITDVLIFFCKGIKYEVIEYIEGKTLKDYILLPSVKISNIIIFLKYIIHTIDFLCKNNFFHNDLHVGNIMIVKNSNIFTNVVNDVQTNLLKDGTYNNTTIPLYIIDLGYITQTHPLDNNYKISTEIKYPILDIGQLLSTIYTTILQNDDNISQLIVELVAKKTKLEEEIKKLNEKKSNLLQLPTTPITITPITITKTKTPITKTKTPITKTKTPITITNMFASLELETLTPVKKIENQIASLTLNLKTITDAIIGKREKSKTLDTQSTQKIKAIKDIFDKYFVDQRAIFEEGIKTELQYTGRQSISIKEQTITGKGKQIYNDLLSAINLL